MLRWDIVVTGAEGCFEFPKTSSLVIGMVIAPLLSLIPSVKPVLKEYLVLPKHCLWSILQ
jgi:hypothetical protein